MKRLVDKDIFTPEQADEYPAKMFEQLNLDKIPSVRLSSIGRKMRSPESSFNVFVSLTDIGGEDLKKCTLNLADSAKTSIMACFYALEHALPSGHLFYVRRKGVDDFWHPFKSRGTFLNKLSYDTEKNEKLMKKFALTYIEFEIWQYEVIHCIFSPCPEPSTIVALYTEFNGNATEIINVASEYNCRSILFSLRTIS